MFTPPPDTESNPDPDDSENIVDLYMSKVRYGNTKKELHLKRLTDTTSSTSQSYQKSPTGYNARDNTPPLSPPKIGSRSVSDPVTTNPVVDLNEPTIDYDSIDRYNDVIDDTETDGFTEEAHETRSAGSRDSSGEEEEDRDVGDDERTFALKFIPKRLSSLPSRSVRNNVRCSTRSRSRSSGSNIDGEESSYTINSYYDDGESDSDDDEGSKTLLDASGKHLKGLEVTATLNSHGEFGSKLTSAESQTSNSDHAVLQVEIAKQQDHQPHDGHYSPAYRPERPKSALWNDFDSFRFRIKQLKENGDLSGSNTSLKKSNSIQTAISTATDNMKSPTTTGTSLSTQYMSSDEGNITIGEKSELMHKQLNISHRSSQDDNDDDLETYDQSFDDWDSQNPINILPSPPRTEDYGLSDRESLSSFEVHVQSSRSPRVNAEEQKQYDTSSTEKTPEKITEKKPEEKKQQLLSRQTTAERHLLEVLDQTKRARNHDVMCVLLDRVVSDTMALYNQQPAAQNIESAVDRLCLSLSDFMLQYSETSPATHLRSSTMMDSSPRRPYIVNSGPRHSAGLLQQPYNADWYDTPPLMTTATTISTPTGLSTNYRSSMVDSPGSYINRPRSSTMRYSRFAG